MSVPRAYGIASARAFVLALLSVAGPAILAQSDGPPAPDPPPGSTYTISVKVELVVLQAAVRDRRGRDVPDLAAEDFKIYEANVPQTIRLFRREDLPVSVGLVIDHSGSMRPKLLDVITAARVFASSSNPDDEMFVVNFNEDVQLGLPPHVPFTNRPEELERAILKTPATGRTALYDALQVALARLQRGKREKKVIILISDGGDNSSALGLPALLRLAGQSSVQIFTIGVFDDEDPDRNPRVLKRLAQETGGEAYFPRQLRETSEICAGIARDIRNQYTLGYVPADPAPPGSYRHIRVTAGSAKQGRLNVRTRTGYFVAGPPESPKNEGAR